MDGNYQWVGGKKALIKADDYKYDCIGESILGCAYLSASYKGVVVRMS